MQDISEYWAEGNSNKAYRNIYKSLKYNKMVIIKDIVQIYYDDSMQFFKNPAELNAYPDFMLDFRNKVIEPFAGQKHYNISKGLIEKQQRWDKIYKKISEKSQCISSLPSLESTILFLLKQNTKTLKKVHAFFFKNKVQLHSQKKPIQKGGSNTLHFVKQFLAIDTKNTQTVKQIMKLLDANKSSDDNDILTQLLAWDVIEYWKIDENILIYSNRHHIFDIWNITIFLLSQDANVVNQYYNYLLMKKKKVRT